MKSEGGTKKRFPDSAKVYGVVEAAVERSKKQMARFAPDPARTRGMVESAIERTKEQMSEGMSRKRQRRPPRSPEDRTVELLHETLTALRAMRTSGHEVDERLLADLERFCGDHPVEAKA